jgi:hypothetical protein
MRRREFIVGLGTAATWPLAARAQQPQRMRRVGVLMNLAADDPEGQARLAAFLRGSQRVEAAKLLCQRSDTLAPTIRRAWRPLWPSLDFSQSAPPGQSLSSRLEIRR